MKKLLNDPDMVNAYMAKLEHPLKREIEAVRKIILDASSKIAERVKWNAPSFFYKEDMAAFTPRYSDYVLLIFVFPKGLVKDNSNLLEGEWTDRRMVKFYNMNDIQSKKRALQNVVKDWVTLIEQ
jgi:hypothetical protein